MFHFFKKASTRNSFDFLGVDMHSHLLPAVDDGSQSVEQSMYFINELQELGFRKIITTPHIYPGFYPNNQETLQKASDLLSDSQHKLDFFSYAAEYFLTDTMLDNGPLLTFNKNYVLVEISFVGLSMNFEQMLFELIANNYIPILAHPERYLYLKDNLKFFDKIKGMGCQLQVNINSLGGYYGKASEEMAWEMINKKIVDFLGTDLHHEKHLDSLKSIAQKGNFKKISAYTWKNPTLFYEY